MRVPNPNLPNSIGNTKFLDEKGLMSWAWRKFLPIFALPINLVTRVEVPATASARGELDQIAVSSTHLYVCVAKDSWKRATLSSF